jgi:LmbE family N-acetylglucosaminyl deacetylase
MSKIILAVLAHPDDVEFLCGGTLIRLRQEHQCEVHIASMTPGDCGSAELPPEEIARVRRLEGQAAAALIGATYHCLEERDLLVSYSPTAVEKAVRLLRSVKPDIVLTHSPSDYHLDHEMTSLVVRGATFAAPVPNFPHGPKTQWPLAHIPHLYYCDAIEGKDAFGQPVPPGLVIDISGVIDLKGQMLSAHASQRDWLIKHHGMDHYVEEMRRFSARRGQKHGVAFAEGFRQHLGHSYPQTNLLGEWLGALA